MKLIGAFDVAGIELIGEGASSPAGGRGVRLKADFDPSKISDTDDAEARAGGSVASFGTLALLLAFGLLSRSSSRCGLLQRLRT